MASAGPRTKCYGAGGVKMPAGAMACPQTACTSTHRKYGERRTCHSLVINYVRSMRYTITDGGASFPYDGFSVLNSDGKSTNLFYLSKSTDTAI